MKGQSMGLRIRAMIFDDDPAIRSLLRAIFELREYEVMAFAHAFVCQMCQCPNGSVPADIIICDISMPGITGVEFLEHQRMKGCRSKNLAMMSGFWSESDRRRARNLDCQIFEKPFTTQEIVTWLDACEKMIDPKRMLSSCFQEQAQAVVAEEDS